MSQEEDRQLSRSQLYRYGKSLKRNFNGGNLRKYVEGLSTGAGLSSFIDSLRQEQLQDSSALSADEGADIPDDTVEEDMEDFQNDIPFWENLMKNHNGTSLAYPGDRITQTQGVEILMN
ncbi:hypothetical protein RvY_03976 [Ramazzottius varieornatus]|uniref:Uncharacterized protein n=1 Tax=Ramazzottius varieornatus TaxID=947166 RepID=A0A1D1UPZ7_RAMVA|nr:hypothetical protein RvY_03976 [Ramazzottius varieornatus]